MRHKKQIMPILLLILLVLVGCSSLPAKTNPIITDTMLHDEIQETATKEPVTLTPVAQFSTPTEIILPTPTDKVGMSEEQINEEGIPLSPIRRNQLVYLPTYQIFPSQTPGWNQVTNLDYGFTFRYPANLPLVTSGNVIRIYWGEQDLAIGFRRAVESLSFEWLAPSYLFRESQQVNLGTVDFLGMVAPKSALVFTQQECIILYNNGSEVEAKKIVAGAQVGQVNFTIVIESPIDFREPPSCQGGIPPDVQSMAEQILATFSFQTYAFSGWQEYTDPDYGISFDYPTEWEHLTQFDQAPSYTNPNKILKRERFSGPGGVIDLDIWDAREMGLLEWMNWWHAYTQVDREAFEPEQPNARMFDKPAILFVQPGGGGSYTMPIIFFSDGKYIYRLTYIMEDGQIGLQVFFTMLNSMKSELAGASGPTFPPLDIN